MDERIDTSKQTRRSRMRMHPRFFEAVMADAKTTLYYRGEYFESERRLAPILSLLRLIWASDAFFAQVVYRFGSRMGALGVPVLPRIAQAVTMVAAQMSIGETVIVRPGVSISHGQVTIGGLTEIRAGTLIAPFVSVGLVAGELQGPIIGNRCVIGTGARILGPIQIGNRVRVGANAVVLNDVPDDGIVVGVPGRLVENG